MDIASSPDAALHAGPHLRLLGPFSLESGGGAIAVPATRARALLGFLACHPGRPQGRERLAGLLWGDRGEDQARQSLRQSLTALRELIGDAIVADRSTVTLGPACSSDVAAFEVLVATSDPGALRKAVDLYRGDLLTGLMLDEEAFTTWLTAERARLRNLALDALESLMAQAGPAQRLADAARALALDPFREESHRQTLLALAESGRRNDALLHYRALEGTLRRELGVAPEPETRAVFDAMRSRAAPPTASAPHGGAESTVEKPAIAVLPFDDLGSDATTARIADGVTEDIITDLGRFRGIDVIARNSTAGYRGHAIDPREVARDLDVHYVLAGTIQRRRGRLRVTAQLLDAASAATLWSERWDRPDRDVFAVQVEVAEAVAATLGGMGGSAAITAAEIRKARRRPPESLTAYHHYLLANAGRSSFTRESIVAGLAAADRAIALEPGLGRAYVARAWLNYITIHYGRPYAESVQAMRVDAERAVALDPHDAEARVTLAFQLTCSGHFPEAEQQIAVALQANPSNVQVLVVAAALRGGSGDAEEAAMMADKVMRLDPCMTAENLNCVKDAYFFSRRFDAATAIISRIPVDARGRGARLMLTLSHAMLGHVEATARSRAELLANYPGISVELLINQEWRLGPAQEALLLECFRAAELPLCAAEVDLAGIPNPRRLAECKSPAG
ncbi:MAG TPA: BTAD domain-containing putative transcriptional regulator [Candidatus Cybelea sp.]|nr:BTAD domain-containing putative transcriptional regulator [Candidatus Cybelea sp.]